MKILERHFKKLLIILCLTTSPIASAEFRNFNDWTTKEKALFTSYALAAYIDHRQTRVGLRNGYVEKNPVYGSNPHQDKAIAINALVLGGAYYLVGAFEPDEFNPALLGGNIARWGVVLHNDSVGVSWQVAF